MLLTFFSYEIVTGKYLSVAGKIMKAYFKLLVCLGVFCLFVFLFSQVFVLWVKTLTVFLLIYSVLTFNKI